MIIARDGLIQNGIFELKDMFGNITVRGSYRNGKPHGNFIEYYSNDFFGKNENNRKVKHEVNYVNGKIDGHAVE